MFAVIGRVLRHTRLVMSGSPPLYRLIVLGCLISAALQSIYGVPASLGNRGTPAWFDIAVVAVQGLAALAVLVALYVTDESPTHPVRLWASLNMEAAGLTLLQTVLGLSFVAVIINNGGPFTATVTWIAFMFWVWVWTRLHGIRLALKALRS